MAAKPTASILAAMGRISSARRSPPSSDCWASRNVVSIRRTRAFFFAICSTGQAGALLGVALFDPAVAQPDDPRGEPRGILGPGLADGDGGDRDPGRHLDDRVEGIDTAEMLRRNRHADHGQVGPCRYYPGQVGGSAG